MKKDNPTATGKELKTKFGELWKSMSDAEKKPYNDAYMKEKAAYDAAVAQQAAEAAAAEQAAAEEAARLAAQPPAQGA